jgi:hypothetical protein
MRALPEVHRDGHASKVNKNQTMEITRGRVRVYLRKANETSKIHTGGSVYNFEKPASMGRGEVRGWGTVHYIVLLRLPRMNAGPDETNSTTYIQSASRPDIPDLHTAAVVERACLDLRDDMAECTSSPRFDPRFDHRRSMTPKKHGALWLVVISLESMYGLL